MRKHQTNSGFTVIELLLVIVLVLILASIVAASYSGIRKSERNKERRSDITIIQGKLETYYANFSKYPTLDEINNDKWRSENFKDIDGAVLYDPSSDSSKFVAKPAGGAYAYEVTSTDGKSCDNKDVICTQYTLTATYEGGDTFSKNNIN